MSLATSNQWKIYESLTPAQKRLYQAGMSCIDISYYFNRFARKFTIAVRADIHGNVDPYVEWEPLMAWVRFDGEVIPSFSPEVFVWNRDPEGVERKMEAIVSLVNSYAGKPVRVLPKRNE